MNINMTVVIMINMIVIVTVDAMIKKIIVVVIANNIYVIKKRLLERNHFLPEQFFLVKKIYLCAKII